MNTRTRFFTTAIIIGLLGSATAQISTTWQPIEEFNFDNDGSGKGLTEMNNSGTNNSVWHLNSQGGKFVTDGNGNAVTSGDSGTWRRFLPDAGTANASATDDVYATAYTTGAYRIEMVISGYDFTNHGVAVDGQDQWEIKLTYDTGSSTDIAGLRLRIRDLSGSDGIADAFQTHHRGVNGNKFSGNQVVDSSDPTDSPFTAMAIEFDFDNDVIYYYRNNLTTPFAGTGISGNDLGAFTAAAFNQIVLENDGTWNTAGTSLTIDSITLYQAVPEPSAVALALGALVLGCVLIRRKR